MKVVIITIDDAKKTNLEGAEKLAKTDLLVILSTKAKSEMPESVKEALAEVKAETEFVKLESASEKDAAYAYYAGLHDGKGHTTFIVATDKTKVTKFASKSAKVYTSFKSIADTATTEKKSTTAKKTSSTTTKKTTSSAKKTSSSSTKKKTSKKDEDLLTQLAESVSDGKVDTDKLLKTAKKFINDAIK